MLALEIEKAGLPVAFITAMSSLAKQSGAIRIVMGTKIPHPCGDRNLSAKDDKALRRAIVDCALEALQTDVSCPTIFVPDVTYTSG